VRITLSVIKSSLFIPFLSIEIPNSNVHLEHLDLDFLDDPLHELDHLLFSLFAFSLGGFQFVRDFLGDTPKGLNDFFFLDFPFLPLPLEEFTEIIELLDELLVDLLLYVFPLVDFVLQVVGNFRQVLIQVVIDVGV
jgi:hypothetical protein